MKYEKRVATIPMKYKPKPITIPIVPDIQIETAIAILSFDPLLLIIGAEEIIANANTIVDTNKLFKSNPIT